MAGDLEDCTERLFRSMGEKYGWFREPADVIIEKLSEEIKRLGTIEVSDDAEEFSEDEKEDTARSCTVSPLFALESDNDDGDVDGNDDKTADYKESLRERLIRKYDPENSPENRFEMFLSEMQTPKPPKWSDDDMRKEIDEESPLDNFIVDDDCFEEEDEEVCYIQTDDVDKENVPSEQSTAVDNQDVPFRAPAPSSSFQTPKLIAKPSLVSSSTRRGQARKGSALEALLTPYSSQKQFKTGKDALVKELFELYNQTVFDNQLPGDFKITWNNKMRTTAGFCYYSKVNSQRVSRIELANKIIDSADRLRDTLVHELCHAAAWNISGVKAGHGPVWKQWARRANFIHPDLPVISRCHSYTINTKFTYKCTNPTCGNTFGRHSKSVNLENSRCAHCHSRLELVVPLKKDGTPRKTTPNGFAIFVKENYSRIKKANQASSHKDVMAQLSTEFANLRSK